MTDSLELHEDIVASIVLDGDLSQLNSGQLVAYYYHRCELLNIDPGEKPFELLRLNGKLKLYCTKAGSAALTRVNQIDVKIIDRDMIDGMCIHTARASLPCGRGNDDVGVVDISGLSGENLANAIMKSATKAKRRAVLALCGQGLVDESELDSIRGAKRVSFGQVERDARALPPAEPEPLCSGKAQPIADACRSKTEEHAKQVGADPRHVWRDLLIELGFPAVRPDQLTVDQGKVASATLDRFIANATKVLAQPEDPTAEDAP